jgi:REP element-mobilizing transposase RayT
MPWGLQRFQQARCLHFVTFSCYGRAQLLGADRARDIFEQTFEQTRQWYGFYVSGYVVMPEHVHLLMSELEAFRRTSNAQAKCGAALALARRRSAVAAAILRLQCFEQCETDREVAIHAQKSGEARTGAESGRLGVEQFSPLCVRRGRGSRNRIAVDGTEESRRGIKI